MSPSKKKTRLKNKKYPRNNPLSVRAPESLSPEAQQWGPSLEACLGWVACLIIVVAPVVFNSQIRNFADLPQRMVVQAAIALFCMLGLMRAAVIRRVELPCDICSCALAAFSLWALVSLSWSVDFYNALYAAVHWSSCALMAVGIVAWLRSDVWLGRLAGSLVISGIIVTILALSQQFGGVKWIPSVGVPSAAFGNQNVLAEFLCCTIAFSASAGWFLRRRLSLAMLCWFSCAAGLLVLYFTRCRSAWLAICCLLLWSVGLFIKFRAGWKVFVLAAVLMVGVGGYAGYTCVNNPAFKSIIGGSAQYRLIVWSNAFELFTQRPVLGHGAGNFSNMYGSVLNSYQSDTRFDKNVQIRRVHNDFFQTAVELGLPGFILFVLFATGVLVMALRLMAPQRSDVEKFIVFAASGSLVAFLVNASFNFPFQRALTPLLACISAAMIIGLYCRQRKVFFSFTQRGALSAAAFGIVVAGFLLLRFNLGIIESDAYFKRALVMEKRKANVQALRFGLQAHAARPERMDVLITVGRAYITTGKLDEGIDALQTVIKSQPYHLNALFILGVGYANAGRSAEALEAFRRVLDIKPDFIEARPIVARLKAHGKAKVKLN